MVELYSTYILPQLKEVPVVDSVGFLKMFLRGKINCQPKISGRRGGGKFDWPMEPKNLGPMVCSTDWQESDGPEDPLTYHVFILLFLLLHTHCESRAFSTVFRN